MSPKKHKNRSRGMDKQEVQPPSSLQQKQQHSLNTEAIRIAQNVNAAVLSQVKKDFLQYNKTIQEETGVFIGFKPGPVEMTWLGVGHLSSPDHSDVSARLPPFCVSAARQLINNGKHFPALQNLERPESLLNKCRIVVENRADQAWLEEIWQGHSLVFYVYDSSVCDDGACVKLIVTTAQDERLISFTGYPQELKQRGPVEMPSPRLLRIVPDVKDRMLLWSRIMHTFLRTHAYMLPSHILVDLMDIYLEPDYPLTSKKYKEDYLDWQILRTDLTLNLPGLTRWTENDDDDDLAYAINGCLMKVGCALAALNRFEQAALLYADIGDTFQESVNSYIQAGQCFFNFGDYGAALDYTTKSIGRLVKDDPEPDLNDPNHENALTIILLSYHAIFEQAISRHGRNNRMLKYDKDIVVELGCLALFSTAHGKFQDFAFEFGVPEGTRLSSFMRSRVSSPARAKNVLVKLMRSGSIEEYKAAFENVLEKPLPLRPKFDTNSSDEYRRSLAKDGRKSAHFVNKHGCRPMCLACGLMKGKLLACPCKSAMYCDALCQRSHWAVHKEVCSHHLSKKATKRKNAERSEADTSECRK